MEGSKNNLAMTDQNLPNTDAWLPNNTGKHILETAFVRQCLDIEKSIQQKATFEKEKNIYNYESGLGLEDIVRNELKRLLPSRYSVEVGTLTDSMGQTAGDVDVIIFNDFWFPSSVLSGATPASRKKYMPIQGTYAVGEIKQTLNIKTLEAAMEKLVCCHRLHRPRTYNARTVENRESSYCFHGLSNPLYSFIFATDIDKGLTIEEIADRFFFINKRLKRLETVRAVCILGQGTIYWSFKSNDVEFKPALFMSEDLYKPIIPSIEVHNDNPAIYTFISNLQLHLFHSVLAPEDFALYYGTVNRNIRRPKSVEINIPPDEEWLQLLNEKCRENH
jgi:hypothetical protein